MNYSTPSIVTPLPGYKTYGPVLTSVRKLRKYGGYQDARVQLSELSLRYFADAATGHAGGIRDFVTSEGRPRGIFVALDDFSEYRRDLAATYIVQTQQVSERFIEELCEESRLLKGIAKSDWKTKDNSGNNYSVLKQFAVNVSRGKKPQLESFPEFNILEYYRLCRNLWSHGNTNSRSNAMRVYRRLTTTRIDHIRQCYSGLNAPSVPEELNFDDFYLFTRSLIYFANVLNNYVQITPEDLARHLSRNSRFCTRILQTRSREDRMRKIRRRCKAQFVCLDGVDVGAVVDAILALDSN